jgi:hypothetical protein
MHKEALIDNILLVIGELSKKRDLQPIIDKTINSKGLL